MRDPWLTMKEKVAAIEKEDVRLALFKALETIEEQQRAHGVDAWTTGLEMRIASYANGWRHVVPEWLNPYLDKVRNETDPEYQKYLELRERFEGIPYAEKKDFSHFPSRQGDVS